MADIISLDVARAHLRLEDDYPAEQLQGYINAAVRSAAEFLNRKIFATSDDLTSAVAAVPAALVAAIAARDEAFAAADLVADAESRCAERSMADEILREARARAWETRRGIVADEMVQAAILLTIGHLFENRQDNVAGTTVSELKFGVKQLLMPLRIGMGI